MVELPNPNKYEVPIEVQERNRRHLMALGMTESKPDMDIEDNNMVTDTSFPSMSARSRQVMQESPKVVDSLLSWYSHTAAGRGKELRINANGFIVNIQVNDVKLEQGHLVVTMSADTGVSFALESGSLLKLYWEQEKEPEGIRETPAEWPKFIYLNKIGLGQGFPFFFMVFLAE